MKPPAKRIRPIRGQGFYAATFNALNTRKRFLSILSVTGDCLSISDDPLLRA